LLLPQLIAAILELLSPQVMAAQRGIEMGKLQQRDSERRCGKSLNQQNACS
jgi:hypothetical protein